METFTLKAMSTPIPNDPQNRSAEQQLADAKQRTTDVNTPAEQLPDPLTGENKETAEEKAEREAIELAQRYQQEATELDGLLKLALFFISFFFGLLLIFGIGAIVFYAVDWALSLFDFDFSDITGYIILALSFLNLLMSFCGCFGTWKLSGINEDNKNKLEWVNNEYEKVLKEIGSLNKTLERDLMRFEVEITQIQNENKELRQNFEQIDTQTDDFNEVRAQSKESFVLLMQLWNLSKMLDAHSVIANILKVEAAYYPKAYLTATSDHGLNEREYAMLIRTTVRPVKIKQYFQRYIPFDHKIWMKRSKDGTVNGLEDVPRDNLLINELERVLLLIYKKVRDSEFKVAFPRERNVGRQDSIQLAEDLLNRSNTNNQNEDDRNEFQQNFDQNEFDEFFNPNAF